jgi:hypothetical protein
MDRQPIEKSDNSRRFTDISLVAYLSCKKFKFKKIDRQKDKSMFHFDTTPELEAETLKFFNHEAQVDPLEFSETLRNLRSYAKQG